MKNIVLCSDGTGNSGGKTRGTNVWRIFNAIDRNTQKPEQISFYDDGVGSDDKRWIKIIGGAFGWGLSRNIRQLYSFLVMNYEETETGPDKVYLFGFSRGAFTVRSLAGMICKCGLLDRTQYLNRSDREKMLKRILKAYRGKNSKRLNELKCEGYKFKKIEIEFVGVWDTVDAVGLPFDKFREKLDKLFEKIFKYRLYSFRDQELRSEVKYGCQALALDDERKTFHPNIWDKRKNVEQVWFAGAHSNVGGGYPKDGMSQVSLQWMIEKAEKHGLIFNKHDKKQFNSRADVHSKLYDSRSGIAAYYRYAPRKTEDNPVIHGSVYERIIRATEQYAPLIIPGTAALAKGTFSGKKQSLKTLCLDKKVRDKIKRLTRFRKWVYYTFLIFNLAVTGITLWFMLTRNSGSEPSREPQNIMELVFCKLGEFVNVFVPEFLERFVTILFQYPWFALGIILIFSLLLWLSSRLKKKISETAFKEWQKTIGHLATKPEQPKNQNKKE